jgi:Uma2 family endonuclease
MASLHETLPEPLQPFATGEPPLYRFSVEQFDRLVADGLFAEDDRIELLDGVLFEMTPLGPDHCHVNSRLVRLLRAMLEPAGFRVEADWPVILSASRPQPDAIVLRNTLDEPEDRLPQAGDMALVIEISDKSLATDRKVKARLYAAAGIEQYWIVNVVDRQIEVLLGPGTDDRGTPCYRHRAVADDRLDVMLDGRTFGTIRIAEVLRKK